MKRVNKNAQYVKYILDNLRDADRIECIESKGENYKEIIYEEIMKTDFDCLVGQENGKAFVMGGVWPVDSQNPEFGCIWLLSTDDVKNHQISVLRQLKKEVENYDKKYFMTCNYIHKNNLLAKRWLKYLGFKFGEPYGVKPRKNFTFFYRINQKMKGLN